jgi:hypothetical protein
MGLPSISASALSRPKRELPPPAKTYPNTLDFWDAEGNVFSFFTNN